MITRNKPYVSLKAKYGKAIRIALVVSLAITTILFLIVPEVAITQPEIEEPEGPIITTEIPVTTQPPNSPAPVKPTIAVPGKDEDLPGSTTIQKTNFKDYFAATTPPPPPENAPDIPFSSYDEPPALIGGYASLQRAIQYPELAVEAGVEGTVFIRAFINEDGDVEVVVVQQGIPKSGLNEAAVEAVKRTKWKPAIQRDKAVGVWVTIPIIFRLGGN